MTNLTFKEFASLLAIGNAGANDRAPAIPAEHIAKLILLGYIDDLEGMLRTTPSGKLRIAAEL
jgi:hypothetical protein